jgi:excisionase family DNA binding protein
MTDANGQHPNSETRLLTVKETATLLGCSRANVYALIDAGELPVISIGKSRGYRIDRQDIEQFIERRKTCKGGRKPAPPAPRPKLKHIRL